MKTLHILLMILFVAGTGAASGESTLTGGTVEDIFLTSSYDGKTVRSQIMIPDGYQEGSPAPLVLSLHGALCTAEDGIFFVRQACNDRGWFIAAPDTHGDHTSGEFSFAGLAAQHDCIDILEYMEERFDIDPERIYVTGASMGGQLTTIIAEKYPDIFAAAYEWLSPSNLTRIYHELDSVFFYRFFADSMDVECEGSPEEQPMEYARRSPDIMAMNLRNIPFKISHGTFDFLVLPHHATDLADAIELWNPLYFMGIQWFPRGHWVYPKDGERTCSYLEQFTRNPCPVYFFLKVDESKKYFFTDLVQHEEGSWSEIGLNRIITRNAVQLAIVNGDITLHLEETDLSVLEPLELIIYHPAQIEMIITGLEDGILYEVLKDGVSWTGAEQEGRTMIITIEYGLEHPETFILQPVPGGN